MGGGSVVSWGMFDERHLALAARFSALLGAGLLAMAFSLAIFDFPIRAPALVLAALAGAGGLCLAAFLVLATPGLR